MRVLVLGGTAFLGRHVVEHALARGEQVTIFNRGRTAPGLFAADVELLRGDRGGDLAALREGSWAPRSTCRATHRPRSAPAARCSRRGSST